MKLSKKDFKIWTEKTERLNQDVIISRGDTVVDSEGYKGVVVRIEHGPTVESHGTIYVWQCDRIEYGADNCEHYPYYGWKSILRIVHGAIGEPDSYWE